MLAGPLVEAGVRSASLSPPSDDGVPAVDALGFVTRSGDSLTSITSALGSEGSWALPVLRRLVSVFEPVVSSRGVEG